MQMKHVAELISYVQATDEEKKGPACGEAVMISFVALHMHRPKRGTAVPIMTIENHIVNRNLLLISVPRSIIMPPVILTWNCKYQRYVSILNHGRATPS